MSKSVKYDASKIAERLRDHSLYIAFAPADKPKIALAVIVENSGFGAAAAAPIARLAIDYYLLGKRPENPVKSGKPVASEVSSPAGAAPAAASIAAPTPATAPAAVAPPAAGTANPAAATIAAPKPATTSAAPAPTPQKPGPAPTAPAIAPPAVPAASGNSKPASSTATGNANKPPTKPAATATPTVSTGSAP
jgi:penicillin-binding protein 2